MRYNGVAVAGSCVLAVALSACASAGNPAQVGDATSALPLPAGLGKARGPGWMSKAARNPNAHLIYVSDFVAGVVRIYPEKGSNPAPIGEITDGISGPFGLSVDGSGDLYVCNVGNFTVTEYPRGSTTYSFQYTGIGYPYSVTALPGGQIDVVDEDPGQIMEFPKGSSRPRLRIPIEHPSGVTLDPEHNLYVAYNTGAHGGGPGYVNEYAPHSKAGTKLAFTLGWATNDAFDGDGNLLVADQQGPPIAIDVFPPGASEPSQQITQGLVDPVYLAFSKQRNRLFVADPGASAVLVYDYPSGTLVETLNNGLTSVYGVAVSPEGL